MPSSGSGALLPFSSSGIVVSTLKAGQGFAAGGAAATAVSAEVVSLTEGVLKAMLLRKLKIAAVLIALAGMFAGGIKKPAAGQQGPAFGQGGGVAGFGLPNPGNLTNFGFGCQGGSGGGLGFGTSSGGGGGFGVGIGGGVGFGAGGADFARAFAAKGSACGVCKLDPLLQKTVQKDLKLSKQQLQKLTLLQAKQQQSARQLMMSIRFDTLIKEPDSMRKKLLELSKAAERGVEDILTPAQRKRLQEIFWQQRGGLALADPEAADALKLSQEQRQKIQTIQVDAAKEMQARAMKEMQELFNPNGNPFDKKMQKSQKASEQKSQKASEKIQKNLAELQKSIAERLVRVLTDEQRERWTELQGKPLKAQESQSRKTSGAK
jgi:hypothetical protein